MQALQYFELAANLGDADAQNGQLLSSCATCADLVEQNSLSAISMARAASEIRRRLPNTTGNFPLFDFSRTLLM